MKRWRVCEAFMLHRSSFQILGQLYEIICRVADKRGRWGTKLSLYSGYYSCGYSDNQLELNSSLICTCIQTVETYAHLLVWAYYRSKINCLHSHCIQHYKLISFWSLLSGSKWQSCVLPQARRGIVCAPTLYLPTFAVRETASLVIMGALRVPPLNPSETIVLSYI